MTSTSHHMQSSCHCKCAKPHIVNLRRCQQLPANLLNICYVPGSNADLCEPFPISLVNYLCFRKNNAVCCKKCRVAYAQHLGMLHVLVHATPGHFFEALRLCVLPGTTANLLPRLSLLRSLPACICIVVLENLTSLRFNTA